jgi:hypothetical protein
MVLLPMSELGQTRKFDSANGKSVLHPGANLTGLCCRVRFVPQTRK